MFRPALTVAAFLSLTSAIDLTEAAESSRADGLTAALQPVAQIQRAAAISRWSYDRLADLTDLVGPRLSGSRGADAAVEQLAAALRQQHLEVRLEPVRVSHWERGVERAELVGYRGRPDRITQHIALTALGSSGATPEGGLTADILLVHDFDELARRAAEVPGHIVLFDVPFSMGLVAHGQAGSAYRQNIAYRVAGPSRAAELGAVATLVRSLGSADFRLPHTGVTRFKEGQAAIPAAAVSSEDALLIERLAARGAPVSMHLTLTPRVLPDVDTYNVVADIPGTDPKAGVVLVSGHVDAWDLGQGAIDDGAGVIAALGAVQIIHELGLHPRRTIRFVGWMNEENGSRGEEAYVRQHAAELPMHVAAIESDAGAGHLVGLITNAPAAATPMLEPLMAALAPAGAGVLEQVIYPVGSDLEGLEKAGVPAFEPKVDVTHYFDYHHTAADTLDKVEVTDLQAQVGGMAALAWFLANTDRPIVRLP